MSDRIRPSDLPYKGDRPMGVGFCKDNNGNLIWDGGDSFSGTITFPDLASFQAAGGAAAYGDVPVWVGGELFINGEPYNRSLAFSSLILVTDIPSQPEADANNYAQIIAEYDAEFNNVQYWDGFVSKRQLPGSTIGGNSLWSYVFEPYRCDKTIIITAGIHGSETKTHQPLKQFLRAVINNPSLFPMLENVRLVVCPCMNPDSYGIRRGNGNTPPVDINRNFLIGGSYPTAWSSYSGTGDFYKGAAAFSEVETQAIRYMVEELYADPHALVDFHNYGNNLPDNGDVDVLAIDGWSAFAAEVPGQVFRAMGKNIDYGSIAAGNLLPDPTVVAYMQQRKIHVASIELNPLYINNVTAGGMSRAVHFVANTVCAYAQIPALVDSINLYSPELLTSEKSAAGTKSLVANQSTAILVPDSEVTFTPTKSGKMFNFFAASCYPGSDIKSKIILSPVVYQGTLDANEILKNEVELSSSGSTGSRNFGSLVFSSWVEKNVALKSAIYYRSLGTVGTPNISRAGCFSILVPTTDRELTFEQWISANPLARKHVFEHNSQITLSSAQSTNAEIAQLTQSLAVDVRGFILMEYDLLVETTPTAQQLIFMPWAGNGVAIVGSNTDSTVRAMRERITTANPNNPRQRMKFWAIQHCFPSSKGASAAGLTQDHTVGLQYRVASGSVDPVLHSSKITAYIIPSVAGKDCAEWWQWQHTASVPVQLF